MEKKTSKLSRAVVMGITLVVLLIPFSLYYVVYVSSQQAYFIDRSHRSLAGIGSQIVSRVAGLRSVVENAGKKGCKQQGGEHPKEIADLAGYFNPNTLRPFGTQLEFDPTTVQPEVADKQPAPSSAKPVITLEFKQAGSQKRLVLHYSSSGNPGFKQGQFSVRSATEELLEPVVDRFVLHERRAAGEDVFDKVFVADSETGTVVFEYGLDSITIGNLDELLGVRSSDSTSRKTVEVPVSESGDQDGGKTEVAQKASDTTKPRPPATSNVRRERGSSDLTKINIADVDYKLFVQPIQLTVPRAGSASEQGLKLTVCGLVRSDNLTKKSFSFSYTLLLLFLLLVLMTTVSGPLIKLRLLGPKDRLRRADAVLTACSAFFGTALLTLTLLDGYGYADLENQLDEQLKRLAASVDRNLRDELGRAIDQLDALNEKLGDDLSVADKEFVCAPGQGDSADEGHQDSAALNTKYYKENILGGDGLLDPRSAPYPYFNDAMWTDLSGDQQIKFTTKRRHTAFVSVRTRQFFANARDGKLWNVSVSQDPRSTPRRLVVEALNSRTSGENVAVISEMTSANDYVSAVDARLLSLYEPVLPASFGFCVIDDSGGVLFHTDDVKNLEENFFEECNNERKLRSAVQARESEWVDVPYLGRSHRAFVTPIKDMPWTLVAFRDKQIPRTVNLEIMTLVAIAFTIYALFLILVLALIFVVKSEARLTLLWPIPEPECYEQMALVNSALFLITLILILISSRGALIVWAVLFPMLAIGHALLLMSKRIRLWRSKQLAARRSPDTVAQDSADSGEPGKASAKRKKYDSRLRKSYSLALVSMLAIACVAPTVAFFKLVRDEQIRLFIRQGQMSLATGLERREDQVRNQYSYVDPPVDVGLAKDEFVTRRLASPWDVYDSFFFDTKAEDLKPTVGRPLTGPLCWFLTTFSPFYNETCVDSHGLVRGQSSDARWSSSEEKGGLILSLHPTITGGNNGGGSAGPGGQPGGGDFIPISAEPVNGALDKATQEHEEQERGWTLTSTIPGFIGFTSPLTWVLVVLVAIMLVVAYFVLRFAARRIVLLDIETPRSSFTIPPSGRIDKNYLVVSPPAFARSDRFPEEKFFRIDLSCAGGEEWWEATKLQKAPRDLPVVIDHFEFNRDDAGWNERKLQFVEQLLSKGTRHVLIVSSVDPINFPLSRGKKNGADTGEEAEQSSPKVKQAAVTDGTASSAISGNGMPDVERWSVALASFVRVETFEQAKKDCPELFKAVGAEDHPWRYLESLAPRMATDADAEELIAEVGDQAETYYRAVWSTCSREERLTLFRVAQDGLVGRFDPDLRRLMQRGLILRDPSLRLMDESFRRFVLRVAAAEGVNTYRADVESHWERLKVPLVLVLLGAIAFLFITQKELYDSTISLVSALTGGVVVLLKLFGVFQKNKDSSSMSV